MSSMLQPAAAAAACRLWSSADSNSLMTSQLPAVATAAGCSASLAYLLGGALRGITANLPLKQFVVSELPPELLPTNPVGTVSDPSADRSTVRRTTDRGARRVSGVYPRTTTTPAISLDQKSMKFAQMKSNGDHGPSRRRKEARGGRRDGRG